MVCESDHYRDKIENKQVHYTIKSLWKEIKLCNQLYFEFLKYYIFGLNIGNSNVYSMKYCVKFTL